MTAGPSFENLPCLPLQSHVSVFQPVIGAQGLTVNFVSGLLCPCFPTACSPLA